MNILDKVIAYFNPERAARRAYFRSSLERGMMRRQQTD